MYRLLPAKADVLAFGRGKVKEELRAYKIRLYPNKVQREMIAKTFGCGRFIWNKMLSERKNAYTLFNASGLKGKALFDYNSDTEAHYKRRYPFLAEVDSASLQQKRIDLDTAYKNFFAGLKTARKVGFPKFKSRRGKQSYRTPNTNNNVKINFYQKRLKLPKIKEAIRYKDDRTWNQSDKKLRIRNVTVSKTKSGKYFVSILVKHDSPPPLTQVRRSEIGAFDMSASKFLVGMKKQFGSPRFYRSKQKQLKRLHRRLSRKKKGSENRIKSRLRLLSAYEKITNRRLDWTHKTALELARSHDAVILEDLNIEAMKQFNKGLAKSVSLDFSWGLFKKTLEYKLKWHGKFYQEVGKFYPSSKLCSKCGYKNDALMLSDRDWTCPSCKVYHDRDVNAAANLEVEGVRLIKARGIAVT